MLTFKASELDQKTQYKLLIGSVVPRPLAFVTTQSDGSVVNAAPFSFFNIVSYDPAIILISIQRNKGLMKDTAYRLSQSKEAVVHIVDTSNVEAVNITSTPLERYESEVDLARMTLVSSSSIATPAVQEAAIRFETILYHHHVIVNDVGLETADVFLLRIVHYHIAPHIYHDGYILQKELEPVSRLEGNEYATIGQVFELERPTGRK